jgi:hypothetical protein
MELILRKQEELDRAIIETSKRDWCQVVTPKLFNSNGVTT